VLAKVEPPLDDDELFDEELFEDEEPLPEEVLAVLKFITYGVGFLAGIPVESVDATTISQGVDAAHL
jgi:hypothetical protein